MTLASTTFDPGAVSRLPDPLPALRDLQEHDPVHWSPRYRAWLVTRYDDVRAGLHDPRMTPGRAMPDPKVFEPGFRELFADYRRLLDPFMLFRDPPDHTRLRGLVNRGFTPSAIEGLRPRVAAFVEELLAAMPKSGTFDFVPAFAYPLPARVIAELIGVPESILDDLKRWSDGFATSTAGTGEDLFRRAAIATSEMGAYLRDFTARRRENPGEAIIDALIDARDGQDRLSTDELVANPILFLVAGHETTTNLLSSGLRTLLRNPDALADLRANLDDPALVRNTVEEMLRHDGALFMSMRVALQSFEWHGRSIEKGQRVFLYHLSANRDPRVFEQPDRFDIRRKDASRHIAFGYGIHFCLGAPLARLEVEVALPALLRRYPDLALVDESVAWKTNFVLRGLTALMLRA